jgi:signal transduction histidine kinase
MTLPPGPYLALEVGDTGPGIPPALVAKIFDPFFTTKRGHGGSGLGLSIIHNLITGILRGTISVESQPNQGTTFTICFPRKIDDHKQIVPTAE